MAAARVLRSHQTCWAHPPVDLVDALLTLGRHNSYQVWLLSCRLSMLNRAWRETIVQLRLEFTACRIDFTLGGSPVSEDAALRVLYDGCPRLKCCDIRASGVTVGHIATNGFLGLVSRCRQLEELSLVGCPISFSALAAIGRHGKELRSLSLENNGELPMQGLFIIAAGCPHLTDLSLSSHIVQSQSVDRDWQTLLIMLPQLTNLSLFMHPITAAALKASAGVPILQQLVHLELASSSLGDAMFDALHLPRLQVLNLHHCEAVSSRGLILAKLPSLTHLDCLWRDVDADHACAVLQALPHLQILSLESYNGEAYDVAAALAQHCRGLRELHVGFKLCDAKALRQLARLQLHWLDLDFSYLAGSLDIQYRNPWDFPSAFDASLAAVAHTQTSLQRLDLCVPAICVEHMVYAPTRDQFQDFLLEEWKVTGNTVADLEVHQIVSASQFLVGSMGAHAAAKDVANLTVQCTDLLQRIQHSHFDTLDRNRLVTAALHMPELVVREKATIRSALDGGGCALSRFVRDCPTLVILNLEDFELGENEWALMPVCDEIDQQLKHRRTARAQSGQTETPVGTWR